MKAIVILIFILCNSIGYSQDFEPFSEVSFQIGASQYKGELNSFNSFETLLLTMPTTGVGINRRITKFFKLGIDYNLVNIRGDDFYSNDLDYFIRNLSFKNTLHSISARCFFNPIAFPENFKRAKGVTFSAFVGLGIVYSNPRAKSVSNGQFVALKGLTTEGQGINILYPEPYKSYILSVPLGIELEKKLSKKIFGSITIYYVPTFTDYLDDIGGGVYPNPLLLPNNLSRSMSNRTLELLSPSISRKYSEKLSHLLLENGISDNPTQYISSLVQDGTPRGQSHDKDHYYFLSFKFSFIIPDKIKCI